jgi:hypothetical protein
MPYPQVVPLEELLRHQGDECGKLGSTLYAQVLGGVLDDLAAGGVCAAILLPRAGDHVSTALPLRFLGAVHRQVLDGRAPALAAHYPSVGGTPGQSLVADFLATVADLRPEIEERIEYGVQTNEVGRAAVLVGGYAEVARRSGLPLRVLEVGASAGLNLRWDRFWYDTGASTFGDPASGVRFEGWWEGSPASRPDLATGAEVAVREGCDRNPLDATSEDGRNTLRSYVWPDQRERFARLDAALAVAAELPASVVAADVGEWVEGHLAEPVPGLATVVVHSIVWQYLSRASRDRMRAALRRAGARARASSPVAWLRMEPAGPLADLRLTWWPGGGEEVLGFGGYHGRPVRWGAEAGAPVSR